MALLEFLNISDNKISPYAYCLDSASDNLPTFELLNHLNIHPIISLNERCGKKSTLPTTSSYSECGYPICSASLEMKFDGTCQSRKRHKFICPRKTKDGIDCPNGTPCSPSAYGRVVYVNFMQDIKRMGYHLYRSKSWSNLYKQRTATKRMNNRILNDYNLATTRVRTRKNLMFMMTMIGINIHMDAWIKSS